MAGAVHQEPGFGSPGWYASAAPEQSKAVVTGKGALSRLLVANKNAAERYVFVYDGADASGVLIAGPFPVAAHGSVDIDFPCGVKFTTGLFVALSSSDSTYTAGSTDAWFNVGWRGL